MITRTLLRKGIDRLISRIEPGTSVRAKLLPGDWEYAALVQEIDPVTLQETGEELYFAGEEAEILVAEWFTLNNRLYAVAHFEEASYESELRDDPAPLSHEQVLALPEHHAGALTIAVLAYELERTRFVAHMHDNSQCLVIYDGETPSYRVVLPLNFNVDALIGLLEQIASHNARLEGNRDDA
jgi:hypothetical protein